MPMKLSQRLVLIVFFAAQAGCAWFHHPRQPKPPAAGPRLIGSIAFVDDELHFVLVDTGSPYTPAAGTALKSFHAGSETGVLTVSPEHKRPFIAADIVQGAPQRGDQVFE